MSTATQARELVIAVGTARGGRVSVKQMLADAALGLRIGFRRARAIYHGEARLIGADEWRTLVARADALGIKQQWEAADYARLASAQRSGELPPQPLGNLNGRNAASRERAAEERRPSAHASAAGGPVS